MVKFFSSLMTILMVGLVGILLFKNIVSLIDVIKNRKLAKKVDDLLDNSNDNNNNILTSENNSKKEDE